MGAKDTNPFSRIVAQRADEKADEVKDAGARLRARDDEPRQAANDRESGRREVPSAVTDNADGEERVGEELGLGRLEFHSAKEKFRDEHPGDDVASQAEAVPSSGQERIAARGSVPQFNIDGQSTRDALNAASGDDNTDVGDRFHGDPRDAVRAARDERNPLNDPQISGSMALVDEAANSAATNPYSVAEGSDALAQAIKEVYGEPKKDPDAGKSSNVEVVHKGSAGKTNQDAAYWDDDKGEIVYAEQVTDSGKAEAEKGMTTTRDHNKANDGDAESTGTGLFGAIGEFFAEREYQQEWGETERKAAELHAARKAGGGVGTPTDPDMAPPTEAEIAFAQAMKDALGVRRIPGDIDPVEGDGTATGGQVDRAVGDSIIERRSNESLVGNPTGATPTAPRATPGGHPGPVGPRQGGDIDPEEGSAFTGGQRTEGPEDVDFGVGSQPLIGLDRNDDEDEDEDSSGSSKSGNDGEE